MIILNKNQQKMRKILKLDSQSDEPIMLYSNQEAQQKQKIIRPHIMVQKDLHISDLIGPNTLSANYKQLSVPLN